MKSLPNLARAAAVATALGLTLAACAGGAPQSQPAPAQTQARPTAQPNVFSPANQDYVNDPRRNFPTP